GFAVTGRREDRQPVNLAARHGVQVFGEALKVAPRIAVRGRRDKSQIFKKLLWDLLLLIVAVAVCHSCPLRDGFGASARIAGNAFRPGAQIGEPSLTAITVPSVLSL